MMNCNNYFDMTDQGDSFETWQGLRGPAGTTFTPAVSSAGVISWTNNGGLPNPSPVDIRGPQGPQGEPQTPSDATPLMDGAASAGISTDYARGDHRHPSDYNKAPVIIDTASGSVASFPDGSDGMPLESLVVQIEPVQAAGTPSPENPLPITGWTGCNISHSGEDTSNPTVIAVSWQTDAGTVYGGFYNPITGILTVTWIGVLLSDLTWTYDADNTRFRANVAGILLGQTRRIPFYCSSFLPIDDGRGLGSVPNNAIYGAGSSNAIYIKTDAYTDAESFVAAMGNTQIIYPLRESEYITVQLDQHQMTSLYGANNIWADCGPVSVEYRADTKLYIDSKIAAAVAALS